MNSGVVGADDWKRNGSQRINCEYLKALSGGDEVNDGRDMVSEGLRWDGTCAKRSTLQSVICPIC